MNKIYLSFFIFFSIFLLAEASEIQISGPNRVEVNENFQVEFIFDEISNFRTADFYIGFDRNLFELDGIRSGELTDEARVSLNPTYNKITITVINTSGVSGFGTFLIANFSVINSSDNSTKIDINQWKFVNSSGSTIPVSMEPLYLDIVEDGFVINDDNDTNTSDNNGTGQDNNQSGGSVVDGSGDYDSGDNRGADGRLRNESPRFLIDKTATIDEILDSMNNNNFTYVVAIIIIILFAAAGFWYFKKKKEGDEGDYSQTEEDFYQQYPGQEQGQQQYPQQSYDESNEQSEYPPNQPDQNTQPSQDDEGYY